MAGVPADRIGLAQFIANRTRNAAQQKGTHRTFALRMGSALESPDEGEVAGGSEIVTIHVWRQTDRNRPNRADNHVHHIGDGDGLKIGGR
jgi:hypothetical protein